MLPIPVPEGYRIELKCRLFSAQLHSPLLLARDVLSAVMWGHRVYFVVDLRIPQA
jgi:hypothetical protein